MMTSKESLKYIFNLALNYINGFSNKTGFRHNEAYEVIEKDLNRLEKMENLLEKYEIEDLTELEIALDQYYHRYDNLQTRRVEEK